MLMANSDDDSFLRAVDEKLGREVALKVIRSSRGARSSRSARCAKRRAIATAEAARTHSQTLACK
jgi:hypothetical protein